MCRAKADEKYLGGRRCPSHAKQHIAVIDRKLEQIELELVEGRNAHENALNEMVRASINEHLKRLHEAKVTLNRERKENQEAVMLSDVTIEQMRKHAEAMPDGDKKKELLAKADSLATQLAKKRADLRKKFLKQEALMDALREHGIPAHEREALLASIRSDTGSSNLRSYNSYFDAWCKAEDALDEMDKEYQATGRQIRADKSLTDASREKKMRALEAKWEPALAKQKARVQEAKFNTYQTEKGLEAFNYDVETKLGEKERAIEELVKAGDIHGANIERRKLAAYAGGREAWRKAVIQSRDVRLADRAIRDSVVPRIRQILAENRVSEQDTKKVLEAYKDPAGYFQAKRKTSHWDESVNVLMHLTEAEAEQLSGLDTKEASRHAVQPPTLPQGKSLSEVHSEFQRHHDGGAHRQTTVLGEKRTKHMSVTLKRRELAQVDGYAYALGISRSAYLRAQISTKNPFALLNDRSKDSRRAMKRKAQEFLESRVQSSKEPLVAI